MNKKQYDIEVDSSGGNYVGDNEFYKGPVIPNKSSTPWGNMTVWHWITLVVDVGIIIMGVIVNDWLTTIAGIILLNSDLRYYMQQWDIKQLRDKVKSLENKQK